MRHVQNAQQTVYKRQSDRDDRIHAAVYQPLNEQFQMQQINVSLPGCPLGLTDFGIYPECYLSRLF